jgi:hypothetical protein
MLNEDYLEMLRILSRNEVRHLIVGAYALAAHGYPRATGDIDIWVAPTSDNSRKLYRALTEFQAPLDDIDHDTFTEENIIFQIGVAPRRIDIITSIDGVEFETAYLRRELIPIGKDRFPFISRTDLIRNKRSSGRPRDLLDAEALRGSESL